MKEVKKEKQAFSNLKKLVNENFEDSEIKLVISYSEGRGNVHKRKI